MNTSLFFDSYFDLAEVNCMLVMNTRGTILKVNRAFTKGYGYTTQDLEGQYFDVLFTEKDKEDGKPEHELKTVQKLRQSNDENYIVSKSGIPVWSTGETVMVDGGDGAHYIVKDIINLQSKRQLQLFLNQTEELLERFFSSSTDIAMLILDGSMKVIKANDAFRSFFHINEDLPTGSRISEITHPFWNNSNIKSELTSILIQNQPLRNRKYLIEETDGTSRTVVINTRIIEGNAELGKRVFVIIEEDRIVE